LPNLCKGCLPLYNTYEEDDDAEDAPEDPLEEVDTAVLP
jgi:hypothetical protein